jgi:hypothetical protein
MQATSMAVVDGVPGFEGQMSRIGRRGRICRPIESLPDRMDVDAIRPSTITASALG